MIHPKQLSRVEAGDGISFTCVAYGNPIPHIIWRKNDTNLSNGSQITIREEITLLRGIFAVKSVLEICTSEEGDSGEYSCNADNGARSDGFSFILSVTPVGKIHSSSMGMKYPEAINLTNNAIEVIAQCF